MGEWKTIEPDTWKPENVGDQISGVYISKVEGDEKTSARYYLDTANKPIMVWGSAIIDDRMQYVKIGERVRLTFLGKEKNLKGQPLKLFKVEKMFDETVEVKFL